MKSKEGRKRKTSWLHVNRQIIRYWRPGVNSLVDKQCIEWRVTSLCVGGVNVYAIMGNDMLKTKSCADWEWPRLWAPQTGECTCCVYRSLSRWDKTGGTDKLQWLSWPCVRICFHCCKLTAVRTGSHACLNVNRVTHNDLPSENLCSPSVPQSSKTNSSSLFGFSEQQPFCLTELCLTHRVVLRLSTSHGTHKTWLLVFFFNSSALFYAI